MRKKKKNRNIIKEIKAIGFFNWIWFVVWLKRNEFSKHLDLENYYPDLDSLWKDRKKAHEIDEKLSKH